MSCFSNLSFVALLNKKQKQKHSFKSGMVRLAYYNPLIVKIGEIFNTFSRNICLKVSFLNVTDIC